MALSAISFAFTAPAFAQTRSYAYEEIAVDVDVQPDGTLLVTERLTFDFDGTEEEPYRFAYRDISLKRLDMIHSVQLSEDGEEYQQSRVSNNSETPGTFTVEMRSGLVGRVTWYYPPTADQTRTFTLSYQAEGAVRVGDEHDAIWWIGVFPDRSVPVEQSRMTFTMPDKVDSDELEVTLPAAQGQMSQDGNTITVVRDEVLPPQEHLDLKVQFPSDVLNVEKPAWQQRSEESNGANWDIIIVIIIVLIPFVLILWAMIYSSMTGGDIRVGDGGTHSGSRRRSGGYYGGYRGGGGGGGVGGGGGGGDNNPI